MKKIIAVVTVILFALTTIVSAGAEVAHDEIPADAYDFKTHLTDNDYTVVSPKSMKERFMKKTKFVFEEPYYSELMSDNNKKDFITFSVMKEVRRWGELHGLPKDTDFDIISEKFRELSVEDRFYWTFLYDNPYFSLLVKMANREKNKKEFFTDTTNWVNICLNDNKLGDGNTERVFKDPRAIKIKAAFDEMAEWHWNNWDKYGRFINVFDETPVFGQANDDGDGNFGIDENAATEKAAVSGKSKSKTVSEPLETTAVTQSEIPEKENIFLKNRLDIIAIIVVAAALGAVFVIKKIKANKKKW